MNAPQRSPAERLLHASAYELIAILICAPVLAWIMRTPVAHMGILTVAISALAMTWNMLFNWLFDALQGKLEFERTFMVRICHAVAFELALVAATVPMAAWWLDITLWQALLLDAGVLLFFLPYTVAFNWSYDVLRDRWLMRVCCMNEPQARRPG